MENKRKFLVSAICIKVYVFVLYILQNRVYFWEFCYQHQPKDGERYGMSRPICPCTLLQCLYMPDKWVLRVWGGREQEGYWIFSLTTNNQMYFCRVFAQIPVKGKSILLNAHTQAEHNALACNISHEVWIFDRKFKEQIFSFFVFYGFFFLYMSVKTISEKNFERDEKPTEY